MRAIWQMNEYKDLQPIASVLSNALTDLGSGDYMLSGRLCDDIEELGVVQADAIEHLFSAPAESTLTRRMAARVCENCVEWVGCPRFVETDIPVSVTMDFPMTEHEADVDNATISTPITRLYYLDNLQKMSNYKSKKRAP